jgi:hypothetical protein
MGRRLIDDAQQHGNGIDYHSQARDAMQHGSWE